MANCLKDMRGCNATRATLREGTLLMKGFQMLAEQRPACIAHNKGGACTDLLSNPESGLVMGGCGERGGGQKKGCDMSA